jgi:hypothetical protein
VTVSTLQTVFVISGITYKQSCAALCAVRSSTIKKVEGVGREWGYWHSDQKSCRGWGCTHPRPISTASTGRGWGYWHTWYRNWPVDNGPGWDRPQHWVDQHWVDQSLTGMGLATFRNHSGPARWDQNVATTIPTHTDQL